VPIWFKALDLDADRRNAASAGEMPVMGSFSIWHGLMIVLAVILIIAVRLVLSGLGSFSIWHWLVVLLVILLLFGSGKISGLMGDLAKGIKSFKQNGMEGGKGPPLAGAGGARLDSSWPAAAEPPAKARGPRSPWLWLVALLLAVALASGLVDDLARWLHGTGSG
jgi:TatA/E family protein of Tat protein translocase